MERKAEEARRVSRDGVVRTRKDRILEAAAEVFAERGYEGATVEEIARRAGCTKGAFYHHFPSKEELFLELLERKLEERLLRLRRAWNRSDTLEANAQRVVDRFVQALQEDPAGRDLQIECWAQALRHPKVRARLAEVYARWRDFLVGVAAREVPPDLMPIVTPHLHFWASLLMAIQDGLALQNRIDPQRADLSHWREHLAEVLLAILDLGLPPRPEDTPPRPEGAVHGG